MYKKLGKVPERSKAFKQLMTRVLVKLGRGTQINGALEEAMLNYVKVSRANTEQQRKLVEQIENLIREEER